jgi:hypothetical protein
MTPTSSLVAGDIFSGLQGQDCPAITCFHSDNKMITHDFYQKQVSELAQAVNTKLNNDLNLFLKTHQLIEDHNEEETKPTEKEEYLKNITPMIAPAFSEPFASGTIINGFTPQSRNEFETLVKSAKQFNV